jgi:hypothetical protein
MSFPETEIDRIGLELHELAKQYAEKAAALASDPYFRQAIIKVSVSGFVWALYDKFDDHMDRAALDHEIQVQSAAVSRVVNPEGSVQ